MLECARLLAKGNMPKGVFGCDNAGFYQFIDIMADRALIGTDCAGILGIHSCHRVLRFVGKHMSC